MKERKKHPIFWTIMLVFFVAALGLWIWTRHGGPKINKVVGEGSTSYSSLGDMMSSVGDIRLPSIVNSETDKITCEKDSNTYQILEGSGKYLIRFINTSDYYFVVDSFDIEEALADEENFVENNEYNIRYIRYRTGCKNFENCTVVNWDDTNYTFSMILGDKYDKKEVLDMLGIKESELTMFVKPHFEGEYDGIDDDTYDENSEYKEITTNTPDIEVTTALTEVSSKDITSETTSDSNVTEDITSGKEDTTLDKDLVNNIEDFEDKANNVSIKLPSTVTPVTSVAYPGAVMYSMGGKVILAVVYDSSSDIFGENNEIKVKNNMSVRYLAENPFDSVTEETLYNDYNTIYNNIISIANSVTLNN